jgi:hypothetical protein
LRSAKRQFPVFFLGSFADKARLCELAEHGGCDKTLEVRQGIEHRVERGRGGFWLNLTEQQYRKLK